MALSYNLSNRVISYDIVRQSFWAEISLEKLDLTPVGHWSGTGLVRS